jgi:hypothetical protein
MVVSNRLLTADHGWWRRGEQGDRITPSTPKMYPRDFRANVEISRVQLVKNRSAGHHHPFNETA